MSDWLRPLVPALVLVALAACTTDPSPSHGPRAPKATEPAPAPVEPGPKDSVSRASVDAALKAGLGRFLANVEVEASLDGKGKFVGWRVVRLHGEMWSGIDLQPGDVVTRVNGFKIEREIEADRAFKSLAVASEIRVSLLRDGKTTELRFAIVDEPSASASAK